MEPCEDCEGVNAIESAEPASAEIAITAMLPIALPQNILLNRGLFIIFRARDIAVGKHLPP